MLSLVLQGLAPYRFSSTPQPFSWYPLAALMETGPDAGALILLRKSFWYGSAIWMLRESGFGFLRAVTAVAVILGAMEWMQRYPPWAYAGDFRSLTRYSAGFVPMAAGTAPIGPRPQEFATVIVTAACRCTYAANDSGAETRSHGISYQKNDSAHASMPY